MKTEQAINLVNQVRTRAAKSTQMIGNYPNTYNVKFYITNYKGAYSQEQAIKIVKMQRRLELGMECERFFDLVRWGDAATVLNKYYAEERDNCAIYGEASFTANKDEYLPITNNQYKFSGQNYVQNPGYGDF